MHHCFAYVAELKLATLHVPSAYWVGIDSVPLHGTSKLCKTEHSTYSTLYNDRRKTLNLA